MNTHDKTNGLLTAYALGELPSEHLSEVRAHLAHCSQCQTELQDLEILLECTDAMSQLSADEQACESAKQKLFEAAAQHRTKKSTAGPAAAFESIWRRIMTTKKLTLAAAALIVIAVLVASYLFPSSGITATTFAHVIKNVIKAESISFHSRQQLGIEPTVVSKMYIQGRKLRMDIETIQSDQPGAEKLKEQMQLRKLSALLSNIADFERKDGIELDHFRKTYKKLNIDDRMVAEFTQNNPIEQFRNIKPENAELLRTESDQNRQIDVFLIKHVDLMGIKAELSGKEGERMTVWVDRHSLLPTRILLEASAHVEGKSKDFFEFYDFAWDETIAEDTFDLKPPEGYTLNTENNLPTE